MFRRSSNGIQAGNCGGHFGFPIRTNLPFFDQQFTQILPTMFQVNWPFSSGGEAKNRLSRWRPRRPSWISDRNDFSYFLSTSHHDASYQVSSQLAFRFRRRRKNRFSKWLPYLISNQNDFSYFVCTSHPNASYQVSSQLAFWFRRRRKKWIFKMATMAAILDFRSERF